MLAPTARRPTAPIRFAAIVWLLSAPACAVLPDDHYPAFVEHNLVARYIAPTDGRIRVPATTRELVVRDLVLLPPPHAEAFDSDGTRWLLYDGGTPVELRGRFRAYGDPGHRLLPADLLPGALRIEVLEAPR